ncbi:MAG TPA: O-methyltransferase [Thermomicrobiales bacterium]|nr:O-methyltransferase [Thermomicrobiales bacterium]
MSVNQARWTALDEYFSEHLHGDDPALDAALAASDAAGLPQINVAPNQGKLLMLIAMMTGAKRVLEIGTLGAYSTIWLGRGLPAEGHIDTLEIDPEHAAVAAGNIREAGLEDLVEVHIGKATETLEDFVRREVPPYDLIFIDADKASLPDYLALSLKLARPGSVIIADNVVRHGEVGNARSTDPNARGVQRFIDEIGSNPALESTAIQTVGSKGWDGFAITIVKG